MGEGDGSDDALQYTHAIGLTQLAVTDAGLYMMYASYDDAKVAAELKKPPARSDPPKAYKATKLNEWRSLDVRDDGVVCMIQGVAPDCGSDGYGCDGGAACFSATTGIVSIEGTWAPQGGEFVQGGKP